MRKSLRQNTAIDTADIDQKFWDRIEKQRKLFKWNNDMARPTAANVKAQLDTHEAVCAERWGETIARIKRLEMLIISTAAGIIALLLSLVLS
ncbi:MAG: hypothetical protein VXX02_03600 [Pseudomonadota bacterium]|nr:hypothetical protein [Pseudomonadota bacterium]MEC7992051.1 hypothetical protein [Pseudomonadota bacterium]MEE3175050.1 hypothetical protein [Pseudomonadota bacterium]|tara:strand:- start:442 stop:717 length:276 start_codon:yes stop_codon:yes gene_type:complete